MKCKTEKMKAGGKVHEDVKMDKKMATAIAKKEVGKHVKAMHAKGGMIARGGGAARKSSLVFRRNG
jgi:hypothetical protein